MSHSGLPRKADSQAHLQPAESEILGVGSAGCECDVPPRGPEAHWRMTTAPVRMIEGDRASGICSQRYT